MKGLFKQKLAASRGEPRRTRRLHLVLGDQLDGRAAALRDLDPDRDTVFMAEVSDEALHVASHRQRTTLFLAAMRHFALALAERRQPLRYVSLEDPANTHSFTGELARALSALSPQEVTVITPGEHRVARILREVCVGAGHSLRILADDSFTCPEAEFTAWAEGRASLTMEYFYRQRRRDLNVLIENDKPAGGQWNYDQDNRQNFPSEPRIPAPYRARPDGITREVMALVNKTFPDAPGRLAAFPWPVQRRQALRALRKFSAERLARFGTYQDAMWTGEPFLFHSALSAALNLKLLSPRECVTKAVKAFEDGSASLNNVEGFVRQIIGWREFMRGIYYREGPGYVRRNGLAQTGKLPPCFWTGDTDLNCLRHCLGEVLEHGYGHHIARLMVIGNFALISGVHPRRVHEWFLGMYVDGVEWVTAPNVIGMSQYADHGIVATKPYAASGKYIKRMSNYCLGCRYDVDRRTGEEACPFNTFYWDFLIRHQQRLASHRRMKLVLSNLASMEKAEARGIARQARRLRRRLDID
jgi:deoxyribodipyrimidine photolyase-related protein